MGTEPSFNTQCATFDTDCDVTTLSAIGSATVLESAADATTNSDVISSYPANADMSLRKRLIVDTPLASEITTSSQITVDGTTYTVMAINDASCGAGCLTL